MTNKLNRHYVPEFQKFIDEKGKHYLNLIAYKMQTSERTIRRWYKQQSRPSNAERILLLRIMNGFKAGRNNGIRKNSSELSTIVENGQRFCEMPGCKLAY